MIVPDARPVAGLAELARETGVAYDTLREWQRAGRLDPFRVAGRVSGNVAYDRDQAVRWIADHPPRMGRPRKAS